MNKVWHAIRERAGQLRNAVTAISEIAADKFTIAPQLPRLVSCQFGFNVRS
jgi:hypothetical protein